VRRRKYAKGSEVWIADYRDHLHKRHIKSFDTQRKAKEWLHKTIGEVRDGTHTPERQSINLWEAAARWLQHCRAEKLEPVTLRYYEMTLRHIRRGGAEAGVARDRGSRVRIDGLTILTKYRRHGAIAARAIRACSAAAVWRCTSRKLACPKMESMTLAE
jgi:hypothetical protein